MTAPIFISHSSRDEKVARTICTALENCGLTCWVASRDVGPGENFQEAIVRAIRAAKVMVLVFSENANNSAEVKKELALASAHKLTVIPARVEDVVPSEAFAYELATRQWVNLFENWEDAVERLAAWITRIVPDVASAAPVLSEAPAADPPPVGAAETPKENKAGGKASGKTWLASGTWSGRTAHGAAAEPVSPPSLATDKVAVGRELPQSVRTIAALLIVQGAVRLGLIMYGMFTIGQRVYVSSPATFVQVYFPTIILGLLAVGAGLVILRRSPTARTFGLLVGTILLVSQLYFLTNTVSFILRASQLNPLFLLNFWVITPFNFLVFAATLFYLGRWRPRTTPPTQGVNAT